MPRCKCGDEIKFIHMKTSGQQMPVNPGLVILIEPTEEHVLITRDGRIIKTMEPNAEGYEPHWATCPMSADFRRKKKKA